MPSPPLQQTGRRWCMSMTVIATVVACMALMPPSDERSDIWTIVPPPGCSCLRAVAVVGDVDDDGRADYAAMWEGNGSPRVMVYSGKTGSMLRQLPEEAAGRSLSGIVNGDKKLIVIGDPDFVSSDHAAGRFVAHELAGEIAYATSGDAADERLGAAVTTMGDIDGDALPDFAVCGVGEGACLAVMSGATGHPVMRVRLAIQDDRGALGLCAVPDVDGDGSEDIVLVAAGLGASAGSLGHIAAFGSHSGRSIWSCKWPTTMALGRHMVGAGIASVQGADAKESSVCVVGKYDDDNSGVHVVSAATGEWQRGMKLTSFGIEAIDGICAVRDSEELVVGEAAESGGRRDARLCLFATSTGVLVASWRLPNVGTVAPISAEKQDDGLRVVWWAREGQKIDALTCAVFGEASAGDR
jgi:hypothetical protein